MGRFFTNLQVKNSGGRDGFFKAFKSAATGWEICGEAESEKVLLLGFSECYVTVTCETYDDDPAAAENDAVLLSAALDTEVFSICGIDSDAAVMTVYSRGSFAGETAIGMADAYGMEAEPPEPELWEPLLKPGADISALSEIWQDDAVFVEDLLCESAELFGIDPGLITAEFDYFDDGEPLYLRKSTECPIKLAPKRFPKQTKHSDGSDNQTDDGTVTVFGEKYDIASTTSIANNYCSINDEVLAEAVPYLKRLTSLVELDLSYNMISDISPLAELTGLESLNILNNFTSDINISALKKLPKLKKLSIDVSGLSDLSPLENCLELEELTLWSMKYIPEWICGFKKLKKFEISGGKISDISPISKSTQLTSLTLYGEDISDIKPLEALPELTELVFNYNRISDISTLAKLPKLTKLSLADNEISDISPLAKLTELTELDLEGNQISDITPLFGLVKLRSLNLLRNPVSEEDRSLLKERLPNCGMTRYV